MKAAIIDYGAGNLHSLAKAVRINGWEPITTSSVTEALACDALFLPGVGAFGSAIAVLDSQRQALRNAVSAGIPCLGICLGMQLMMDSSEEGEGKGLGLVAGAVRRLKASRIPQIGWNTLDDVSDEAIVSSRLSTAFFANSFVCEPDDKSIVTAWATHEDDRFVAAFRRDNVVGVQFHPEKSSAPGLAMVREFLAGARR
ncbi:MAG: imidazole glycerol phosphate synthase subunit HisH [Gemmatimonadaceae bacterium]